MAHYFTNDIVKDAPEEITIHFRDFTYKLNSNAEFSVKINWMKVRVFF